jgi:hypothetical protein
MPCLAAKASANTLKEQKKAPTNPGLFTPTKQLLTKKTKQL